MAREINKKIMDEGVFSAEDADVRAIVVRWDALEGRPVYHLGGVSPYEAHAWLQLAADAVWDEASYTGCGKED